MAVVQDFWPAEFPGHTIEDDDPALVRLACGLYVGIITYQKGRAR
jgi:hypothetical protein